MKISKTLPKIKKPNKIILKKKKTQYFIFYIYILTLSNIWDAFNGYRIMVEPGNFSY